MRRVCETNGCTEDAVTEVAAPYIDLGATMELREERRFFCLRCTCLLCTSSLQSPARVVTLNLAGGGEWP